MRATVSQMRLAVSVVVALGTIALSPVALEAQKRCTKGIPCGNTCIAATKTCRVGTGTARPAPRPAAPRPTAVVPDSTPRASADRATAASAEPSVSEKPEVASSRGQVYYARGCSAANELAPANRILFKSAEEAEAAGYRRSRSRGC